MHNKQLYDQLVSWFKTKTIQDSFVKAYERGVFPVLVIPDHLKDKAPIWWINEAVLGSQPIAEGQQELILFKLSQDVADVFPSYLQH